MKAPPAARGVARRLQGRVEARTRNVAAGAELVFHPAAFRPLLTRLLRDARTLLDVGCGTMDGLAEIDVPVRVGVDAHLPYLERRPLEAPVVPIHLDARRIGDIFLPQSFDVVTMVDVIEHFERDDALGVLAAAEQIAARRVVVFTPRGDFPQVGYDAHALGGEELQQHRSVWQPQDFTSRGYAVAVLRGFHGPGNTSFDAAFPDGHEPLDALLAWSSVARNKG